MKMVVVAIRDRALDTYSRPVFVQTIGVAVRSFQSEINNVQGDMFKHPDDYDLYHLGSFDDEVGRFENLEVPKMITAGKLCVLPKGAK